ncbi:hillarin-like isoform X2 [Liolophura sinensis]
MGTYKDFEMLGVFDAQNELEQKQKEEEDILYQQLREQREIEIKRLEEQLKVERDKTVKKVSREYERKSSESDARSAQAQSLEEERRRIEQEYNDKREARLRRLLASLSLEEKTSVAKLVEKHSQEMLLMIAERLMTIQEEKEGHDIEADDDGLLDLSQPPEVSPPEVKKSQMFSSPKVFDKVDNNAIQTAKQDHSTFTSLVKDLTRDCTSDLEKVRALFLWITLKDLNKLDMKETVHPDSPMGLLRGIKCGTESYHDLFKRLCSYAGLFCEIIQGYSKGAGYKPGMRMDSPRFRNCWTAVCIDGCWQFINSNWGARHVKGHLKSDLDDPSELHYKCDEFYFVTDPENHIYQHFPDDPKWQLLECPISMADFINLPVVKSPFFSLGLQFATHYDSLLETRNGAVEIELVAVKLTEFGHLLDPKDKTENRKSAEGRVFVRQIGQRVIFTVAPPYVGRFYFTVYAKEDWVSESLQSACSFQIRCTARDRVRQAHYPKVPSFGPMPSIEAYGILPKSHSDPFVQFTGEDLFIEFALTRNLKVSGMLEYYFPGQSERHEDCKRGVFLHYKSKDDVVFCIRCPKVGMYVFSIFGGDNNETNGADDNSRTNECLFKYLIEAKTASKLQTGLPRACHRWHECRLISPFHGTLSRDNKIMFRLLAPLALDIAVMIADVWFHLKKNKDDVWEGHVYTGKTSNTKVKVYAKLQKDRSRFSPLVEFIVS